ncbi:MAG: SDR family oxidoreductase [Pseudomonadota bacterium]
MGQDRVGFTLVMFQAGRLAKVLKEPLEEPLSTSTQTILITGASRGIGAAIARACAADGYRLILHASAESAQATALMDALDGAPVDFVFEDLATDDAGTRLVAQASALADGTLTAIVNNAGIYEATPLTGPVEDWQQGWARTLAVNVQAPADIIRAGVSMHRGQSREQGGDQTPLRIVNIASRAGHRGDGIDHAGYAASKGAVLAMTKSWARALAGEGIELYAIAPGWVETRMAPADIAAREKAVAEIPLGRVAAPEEVARVALFLLSGHCPSAVGSTLDINGASYVR